MRHVVMKEADAVAIQTLVDDLHQRQEALARLEFELETVRRNMFEAAWVALGLPFKTEGHVATEDDGTIVFLTEEDAADESTEG